MEQANTIVQPSEPRKEDVWSPSVLVEPSAYNWDGKPLLNNPSSPDRAGVQEKLMVDLFCGCGGFSIGMEKAGFRSVLGLDIHRFAVETYARNHPHSATIMGDIRRVRGGLLREAISGRHISLITAGVPCQGFSLCNRKRSDIDQRNFLFKEFARVAEQLRPDAVILENVSGLTSAGNGSFKNAILGEIRRLGYWAEWRMLNAADFGVPQLRRRVFFVGIREDIEFSWPTPTHGKGKRPYVTVWEAIGDLPPLTPGDSAVSYSSPPVTEYQAFMRENSTRLQNHIAPRHPRETVMRIQRTKPGEPLYSSFKQRIRLDPNQPSPTQVSGGIRPQFQFGHPIDARGLTVRERCRLQSIPDWYFISGGIVQGRVQTGNAVPPILAKAVGRQLMTALEGSGRGRTKRRKQVVLDDLC